MEAPPNFSMKASISTRATMASPTTPAGPVSTPPGAPRWSSGPSPGRRGGPRRVKARAWGARSGWIGRPLSWGRAVNGEAGVTAVLDMLRDELNTSMGICGRTTINSIDLDTLGGISPLQKLFNRRDADRN